MTVNLGDLIRNAKPNNFTPIPPGNYEVTVESAEFTTSKSGGNPMFKLVFAVNETLSSGGPQDHANRKAYTQITLTEKAIDMAVGNLLTLGVDQETLAQALDPESGDPAEVCALLVDAQCVIKVVADEYQGQPQAKVKRIIPMPNSDGATRVDQPAPGSRPARPF